MELVLDFAAARGLRDGPNPARWRGNLDAALPKASKVAKVQHHAALDVRQMGAFVGRLETRRGTGARALEFAVLTAGRSGEVRGATWAEIDLADALWTIPAERMKSGREHRVPLSKAAVQLLGRLPKSDQDDLVFPGNDGPLSDMTLTAVLRRMKVDATVHGFRSTFRDWISESTTHGTEVAEMALSHAVGDKVEAAYRRGDLFEKRIALMADWASFLSRRSPSTGSK
jgi:integrase